MVQDLSHCIHASCVALDGRGLLIRGASGSGKSALALHLMAYGAQLVADDRVLLTLHDGSVVARPPKATAGLIEARGLGILYAENTAQAAVCAIVDLDRLADGRLPAQSAETILGLDLPVIHRVEATHFAPALLQYLKCGALNPDA